MLTGRIRAGRRRPANEGEEPQQGTMTLAEHLEELRNRVVKTAIAVIVATVVSFVFIDRIMSVLVGMAGPGHKLIALKPTEMFVTYMKVGFFSGIAISMPFIIFQILAFLAPALTKKEKRYIFYSIPFVIASFGAGLLFGYYIVLPSALRFLLNFGSAYAEIQPSMGEYLSFVTTFLLAVGLVFETPIVIFFLVKIGIVSVQRLTKYRKYALLLAFVISAIITPTPDPINQLIVAVPMYLLYELGILLARLA